MLPDIAAVRGACLSSINARRTAADKAVACKVAEVGFHTPLAARVSWTTMRTCCPLQRKQSGMESVGVSAPSSSARAAGSRVGVGRRLGADSPALGCPARTVSKRSQARGALLPPSFHHPYPLHRRLFALSTASWLACAACPSAPSPIPRTRAEPRCWYIAVAFQTLLFRRAGPFPASTEDSACSWSSCHASCPFSCSQQRSWEAVTILSALDGPR